MLNEFEMTLHLITVDMAVNSYKVYEQGDTIDREYQGSGGTTLKAAWDYINEKRIDPTVIVCLTDGFTEYNFKEICPTLWVLCKDSIDFDKIPFGTKVLIEDEN